jgi:hypothetical protein
MTQIRENNENTDGINDRVVHGNQGSVNPEKQGTRVAAHYQVNVGRAGQTKVIRLRLSKSCADQNGKPLGKPFDELFADRLREADEFFKTVDAIRAWRLSLSWHFEPLLFADVQRGANETLYKRDFFRGDEASLLSNSSLIDLANGLQLDTIDSQGTVLSFGRCTCLAPPRELWGTIIVRHLTQTSQFRLTEQHKVSLFEALVPIRNCTGGGFDETFLFDETFNRKQS